MDSAIIRTANDTTMLQRAAASVEKSLDFDTSLQGLNASPAPPSFEVTPLAIQRDSCGDTDIRSATLTHVVEAATADQVPNALMTIDLGQLGRQAEKWSQVFPRVAPFYAVKSLPDPAVVATLGSNGVNFDCASSAEIDTVLAAGVEPHRIIFANPCKFPEDIAHARECGVARMTFDNADELEKVAAIFPEAELVLRIVTDDSESVCRLSNKYGAAIEDCPFLLERARELRLNVMGVSFHVGSGASNANAFVDALSNARTVFNMGAAAGFDTFKFLDIGGGFPGDDEGGITLQEIGDVVNSTIERLFESDVAVISEPGRFFSHSTATLAAKVIGRRTVRSPGEEDPAVLCYIGDGIYGSFNCMLYDHYTPATPVHMPAQSGDSKISDHSKVTDSSELIKTRVFGPTCDGLDTIYQSVELPSMKIGDWLVFHNMGAYTIAAASRFNGLEKPRVRYIRTELH